MDLVTVYVLTYRRFDHLYSTIDSILCQSYGNIELIISDDGSANFPDVEVEEYIEQHKRSNLSSVIILANKMNVGTVRHLNNALCYANGKVYVPLACGDAFFSDDVVEKIMQTYKLRFFNVLVTTRYGIDDNGIFLRYWPHKEARKYIERWSTEEMYCALAENRYLDFASGSVMTMSADFYKSVGPFDVRYKYWEDGPFLLKILWNGYKIDMAYDIISIRYEQTQGISNSIEIKNSLLGPDIELFWHTDRLLGKYNYGYFHRRMMDFLILRRDNPSWFYHKLLDVLYADLLWKRFRNKYVKIRATPPDEVNWWWRFLFPYLLFTPVLFLWG